MTLRLKKLSVPAITVGLTICLCGSAIADWPEWRGPKRDGVCEDLTPLANSFPDGGPKLVWKSEEIPGGWNGGWGSVAVVKGKVYGYANPRLQEPITTRKLDGRALENLGLHRDAMPAELEKAVEALRTSEELNALQGRDRHKRIGEWLKENISRENRKFWRATENRLRMGNTAPSQAVREKLGSIRDKEFATEDELVQWLAQNGIEGETQKLVVRMAPKTKPVGTDQVLCVDADTGETVWKKEFPGTHNSSPCSSTPAIVDGRCYILASTNNVYCLDAETGEEVWQSKSQGNARTNVSSSFMVVDGMAIVLAGHLTAFNTQTGEIAWAERKVRGVHQSPSAWVKNGKTYLICNSDSGAHCVDPETGNILWTTRTGGSSSAAVQGDTMVVLTANQKIGQMACKLSLEGAEALWNVEQADRGASPVIHDGYVYALGGSRFGGGKALCVKLDTGEVAWHEKITNTEYCSPVAVNGKILCVVQRALWLMKADPKQFSVLGKANLGLSECISPAVVNGRTYLRNDKALVCYDLK